MDNYNVIDEFREFISNGSDIAEYSKEESLNIVSNIGARYIKDVKNVWWWVSISCEIAYIEYSKDYSLEIIKKLVGNNQKIYVAITDDNPHHHCGNFLWPGNGGSRDLGC